MKYELQPLDGQRSPSSPLIDAGKEAIRLAVSEVRFAARRAELLLHASYMFPDQVVQRYHDLNSAPVVVLTDVDAKEGFAFRALDDFIKYVPGVKPEINLKAPPPLPLAPRGDLSGTSFSGGFLNCSFWFETVAHPVHRPSVFLYLVLENYVSNAVGLDLVAQKAITF